MITFLLFGLAFGMILQRSRLCFAAVFRDLILFGHTNLLKVLLVSLIISTIGFALIQNFSYTITGLEPLGYIKPVGLFSVVGGILFGLGMILAGCCPAGALVRGGEGFLIIAFVLIGIIFGSTLGIAHVEQWNNIFENPQIYYLPDYFGMTLATLLQVSIFFLLLIFIHNYEKKKASTNKGVVLAVVTKELTSDSKIYNFFISPWSYLFTGVSLALINVLLFLYYGSPWGIVNIFGYWGAWIWDALGGNPLGWYYFSDLKNLELYQLGFWGNEETWLNLGTIIGALMAAFLAREFRLKKKILSQKVFLSLFGGTLMGYGTRLAGG